MENLQFDTIGNENLQYIEFHFRREWTKLLYPYMTKFLEAILNIPWSSYHYVGPAFFEVLQETPRLRLNQKLNEIKNNNRKPRIIQTHNVEVSGLNYNLFGGSVAEIINLAYKNESRINIRDYIAPTGDLDAILFYNNYEIIDEGIEKQDNCVLISYNGEGQISPLIEHMTRWTFERFAEQIQVVVNKYKIGHIENESAKTYGLDEKSKTYRKNLDVHDDDVLFLSKTIGDYTIIRKAESKMFKIQLAINMKTADQNNIMEKDHYTDHLIEFAMLKERSANVNVGEYEGTFVNVKGINCEEIGTWLRNQIQAYIDRLRLFKVENIKEYRLNKHKVINHLKRIEYILAMTPFLNTKIKGFLNTVVTNLKWFEKEIAKNHGGLMQIDYETKIPFKSVFKPYIEYYNNYMELQKKQSEKRRANAIMARRKKYESTVKPVLRRRINSDPEFKERIRTMLVEVQNVNEITNADINSALEDASIKNYMNEYNINVHEGGKRSKTAKRKADKRKTKKRV